MRAEDEERRVMGKEDIMTALAAVDAVRLSTTAERANNDEDIIRIMLPFNY